MSGRERAVQDGQGTRAAVGPFRVLVARDGDKAMRQMEVPNYGSAMRIFLEEARTHPETLLVLEVEQMAQSGRWEGREHFNASEIRSGVRHREASMTGVPAGLALRSKRTSVTQARAQLERLRTAPRR